MFEKVEEKSFFAPWRQDGWVLGVPPYIIVRNRAPCGAGLARKVFWDDNLSPFSSDKIRAKILKSKICEDFISGNHSHDLAPRRS